jgi:hypothetical protein
MENKIVKKEFFLLTIIVLLFSSCFSAPTARIMVDEKIPQENTAIVMVSSNITITKFNGIDVKSKWYPKNGRRNLSLTIPAGETHFIYNMYWQVTSGQVNQWLEGKDLNFSYNFDVGKEYTIGYYSKYVGVFLNPKHELYFAVWDRLYPNATPDKSHESRIIRQWLVSTY